MLKKLPIVAIIAILLASVFAAPALAAPGGFQGILNKSNAQIVSLINQAISDANTLAAELNSKINNTNLLVRQKKISQTEANGRIMNYKADFANKITVIAYRLIADTNRIVVAVIQEANKRGIRVSVTYVEVNLGGYIFLIDPLRIVGN